MFNVQRGKRRPVTADSPDSEGDSNTFDLSAAAAAVVVVVVVVVLKCPTKHQPGLALHVKLHLDRLPFRPSIPLKTMRLGPAITANTSFSPSRCSKLSDKNIKPSMALQTRF
jgi:hypothetical protein